MKKLKIEYCFNVRGYTILKLDELVPSNYDYVKIDGITYKKELIYDAPYCVAIKSNDDFTGKEIVFINKN